MKRAMLASRVTMLEIMNIRATVLRILSAPIIRMARTLFRRERTPRMNPRAWGMGPLNSTESQAMMEERRTMEQSRKEPATRQVMLVVSTEMLPMTC